MTLSPLVETSRQGNQTARLSSTPPFFACSLGQDAVDLAAHAGLYLDEWQAQVLADSFNERRNGRWAAMEVGLIVPRQNGKGSIIEARQLAGLFLTKDAQQIYSAHQFKTAKAMYRRIKDLCMNTTDLHRTVLAYRQSNEETGIELRTGQRLNFFARSEGSARGFTGDTMFFDEAYNLSADLIADMMPTLSAVPNPQLWYVSSAGMAASEQLAAVRARGVAATSTTLMYREWSAPEDADTDDVDALYDSNPGIGPAPHNVKVDFVAVERVNMSEESFRRERLGIWKPPETNDSMIPVASWARQCDPTSHTVGPIVLAVDISKDATVAAISGAGLREDGRYHVGVAATAGSAEEVVAKLVTLVARYAPLAVVVDVSTAAGALVTPMRLAGIEPLLLYPRSAIAGCAAFRNAVVDGAVFHAGERVLNDALTGAKARRVANGDGWTWDRRDPRTDGTPLVSATNALWGFTFKEAARMNVAASFW